MNVQTFLNKWQLHGDGDAAELNEAMVRDLQSVVDEVVAAEHAATKEQAAQICDDQSRHIHQVNIDEGRVNAHERMASMDMSDSLADMIRALP